MAVLIEDTRPLYVKSKESRTIVIFLGTYLRVYVGLAAARYYCAATLLLTQSTNANGQTLGSFAELCSHI